MQFLSAVVATSTFANVLAVLFTQGRGKYHSQEVIYPTHACLFLL